MSHRRFVVGGVSGSAASRPRTPRPPAPPLVSDWCWRDAGGDEFARKLDSVHACIARVETAWARATIGVVDLARRVSRAPRHAALLLGALEDVFLEDVRLERPLLTSLVTGQRDRPLDAFIDHARSLGFLAVDKDPCMFWEREHESVYEFWR